VGGDVAEQVASDSVSSAVAAAADTAYKYTLHLCNTMEKVLEAEAAKAKARVATVRSETRLLIEEAAAATATAQVEVESLKAEVGSLKAAAAEAKLELMGVDAQRVKAAAEAEVAKLGNAGSVTLDASEQQTIMALKFSEAELKQVKADLQAARLEAREAHAAGMLKGEESAKVEAALELKQMQLKLKQAQNDAAAMMKLNHSLTVSSQPSAEQVSVLPKASSNYPATPTSRRG
jgi:hypothetical protein